MIIAEIQYRNIAMVLAICMGLVALGFACVAVQRLLCRKLTGWNALVQFFPANNPQKTGEAYRASGFVGHESSGRYRQFLIEFASEGMVVTPNFARAWPIMIPWSAIKSVAALNFAVSDVTVYLEYEKALAFSIPIAALPTLQEHVPADRISQSTISDSSFSSLLGGIIDMAKKRAQ